MIDGGGSFGSYSSERRQVLQLIEHDEVVNRQRRELNNIDFDARVGEWLERAEHLLALHGEQANLGLQREAIFLAAARQLLIVPDDVFQREGDLLPRFITHDVGNLFRLDRRQLDEPRQAALAGHARSPPGRPSACCARETALSASRTNSTGSASGWLRIFGYSMKSNASAVIVLGSSSCGTHRRALRRALTDVDTPNRIARGHAHEYLCSASVPPLSARSGKPHGPGTGRRLVRWAADTTHCSTY